MKKRIIAFALTLVMACTTVLSLFSAAVTTPLGNRFNEFREVDFTTLTYSDPAAKLNTMTCAVENDRFSLYIQEYTAEVCVVDRVTGQMLFTNPYDVADSKASVGIKNEILSQIKLTYYGSTGQLTSLNSYLNAAKEEQIVIKLIRNGIRVEYTIGAASKKIIVPRQIEKSDFETKILKPFFESTTLVPGTTFEEYNELYIAADAEEKKALEAKYTMFEYQRLNSFYSLLDLTDPTLTAREKAQYLAAYPITEKMPIYLLEETIATNELSQCEGYIRNNTSYSLEDMLMDHDKVGYELEDSSPAVFKMALEYTLNEDGFQVRLPARGISFDAATYTLETIQILPFMGAGRTAKQANTVRDVEGYNFIPDGSGATISFDQNTRQTQISGTMYGGDFGFYNSSNAASASYQTWRVPAYGTVMTSNVIRATEKRDENGLPVLDETGATVYDQTITSTYKQGYVAFMTEGESLTRIDAVTGGPTHEYHSVCTTFFARQTDSYPLDGITVSGGTAVYTKAIERKYVGNYTIQFRMLSGDQADYVGMAEAYRAYLLKEGILTKNPTTEEAIALYMDFIGDIDTVTKFLGMPVNTKAPLTTFEDAQTIMAELKEAGISNQVIRYLGWANGGMTATAPSKLKVEKVLGGEKGLKDLVAYVQSQNNDIFMDLNFSYVNATDMFDGFDSERDTAKTIDGRPAYDLSTFSAEGVISNLGGTVTVTVPYELQAGEKAEGIQVYYVDGNGNKEACETHYDSEKQTVSWTTTHFSVYLIAYEEPATEAEKPC